jgi:hypothetical protein
MKALKVIAITFFVLLIGLFLCIFLYAFRIETFWHLSNPPSNSHEVYVDGGDHMVGFRAIRCPTNDQSYFVPGALGPDVRPNGFQIEWRLKDQELMNKETIHVTNVSGQITGPDGVSQPLDVPFTRWYGEGTTHKDIFYAFASRGGYSDEPPVGTYRVALSYTLNGQPTSLAADFSLKSTRKAGIHFLYSSHYF